MGLQFETVIIHRVVSATALIGTGAVERGLALAYTVGNLTSGRDDAFTFRGSRVFGIPMPLIVLIVISIIGYVVLNHAVFGLHVFAVGGGEESAHLASVPFKKVKIIVYMISSLLASIRGIILKASLFFAQSNSGEALKLDMIAAGVLVDASLVGAYRQFLRYAGWCVYHQYSI